MKEDYIINYFDTNVETIYFEDEREYVNQFARERNQRLGIGSFIFDKEFKKTIITSWLGEVKILLFGYRIEGVILYGIRTRIRITWKIYSGKKC